MEFLHDRAADATADARGHFYKAAMYLAAFNVVQRRDTVFDTVNGEVCIAGHVALHGFEYAARRGEDARAAVVVRVHNVLRLNAGALQPAGKLLKGQHGIHRAAALFGFILFGDAWTDKNGLAAGVLSFQLRAVRHHRGYHVRKIGQFGGEVFLYQQVYGVTAGGDNDVMCLLGKHALVFGFNYRCAYGSLLDPGKAETADSRAHGFNAGAVIVCDKGRRKAYVYRRAGLKHHLYLFKVAYYLLGVLWTYHKALTAQNAFLRDYVRLVA